MCVVCECVGVVANYFIYYGINFAFLCNNFYYNLNISAAWLLFKAFHNHFHICKLKNIIGLQNLFNK